MVVPAFALPITVAAPRITEVAHPTTAAVSPVAVSPAVATAVVLAAVAAAVVPAVVAVAVVLAVVAAVVVPAVVAAVVVPAVVAAVVVPAAVAVVVPAAVAVVVPAAVAVVESPVAALPNSDPSLIPQQPSATESSGSVAVFSQQGSEPLGILNPVLTLRGLSKALLAPSLLLVLCGCHSQPSPVSAQQARTQLEAQLETQREQLDQIPPPTKSTFMTVHTFDSWQNPVLTIQPSMVELHVLLADANTTPIGVGGMFRPVNARRQELNISPSTLGDAISSIPHSSWPYGRVVAIEEAHQTPPSAEPAVRRNMEVTISKLNDLGIVVYDLSSGKIQ